MYEILKISVFARFSVRILLPLISQLKPLRYYFFLKSNMKSQRHGMLGFKYKVAGQISKADHLILVETCKGLIAFFLFR